LTGFFLRLCVCVAFAAQVSVVSKLKDKDVATKVSFNYKDWLNEQAVKGQCNYDGALPMFDRPAAAAQSLLHSLV
jgi:hypothetical protein